MIARRALLAGCAVVLASCGPPPGEIPGRVAPRRGLGSGDPREDVVALTRGTVVRAVAVARRWVYAATGDAVIVYDRDRRAWLPPFGRDGGFDPSLVRAIAVDPDDDSAWLVTATGAWMLQPLTAFVTRAPAGALPARLRGGSLEALYREFPSLQAFGGLMTRDDRSLQTFPVVAGGRAPDRTEAWLGTAGGGLWKADPLFNQASLQAWGLAASGAGALARAADGVWIAPASRSIEPRVALTFVSRDLQSWRWIDDAGRRSVGALRATALAARGGALWMGTTHGLYRIALDGGAARAFTPMPGLPGDVVLSLLAREDGLWVGTDRGLAFVPADSTDGRGRLTAHAASAAVAVRALLATGDTLWLGTEDGLLLRPPGPDRPLVRPAASPVSSRLRGAVRALAQSDSVVFVALADGVLCFNLRTGAWSEPWPAAPWRVVGEVGALSADARAVWAGGAFGVIAVDRATGGSRILRAGSDLPDAVTDLALDGPWAWIATLGGAVRVRRTADGLIP